MQGTIASRDAPAIATQSSPTSRDTPAAATHTHASRDANGTHANACHYVIVRRDLPRGVQAAMIVHAAGHSAQLPGALDAAPPTTAVVLAASLDELCVLARTLDDVGIAHVFVREPDEPWRDAPMAIGVVPIARACVRRLLAHLPLVRAEEMP
jgi:hypothetical protein